MSTSKIQKTTNYRMFTRSADNRPTDLERHKKLVESMKLYGFLKCFPIVVARDSSGKYVVKDGQHRLAVAESLGLPAYWVEVQEDFDIAVINSTSKVWQLRDYAEKYAANGRKDYQEVLEFAATHGLPLGKAFALLAGRTTVGEITAGTFQVTDRPYAQSVATLYGELTGLAPGVRCNNFLLACMAVCRVDWFDGKRLVAGAKRCREKLVSYGTRDGYLKMIDDVYNFGRKQPLPLVFTANQAMKDRNPMGKGPCGGTAPKKAA